MSKTLPIISVLFLFFLLAVLNPRPSLAGPASPDLITIEQPGGTKFKARIMGDEFQGWVETEDGYSITKDSQSGFWEFAIKGPDGRLAPSGVKAGTGISSHEGMKKHTKPDRDSAGEKRLNSILGPSVATSMSEPAGGPVPGSGNWDPVPVSGTKKFLIILAAFADRALSTTPASWNTTTMSSTPGDKSVVNFYKDNSFNALTISPVAHTQSGNPAGIVSVTLSTNHPNYGGNLNYQTETAWLTEALALAANYVDFPALDTNLDGSFDNDELVVYFIPAGYEASGSSQTPSIWAHAWGGYPGVSAGGVDLNRWAISGELNNSSLQHPMGVIAHELGHSLCGLPDLYDTTYTNMGLGGFSVMAKGSWGRTASETQSGTTPVTLDAWSRQYTGWADPRTPYGGTVDFGPPLDSGDAPVKLFNLGVSATEYFLVENRFSSSWDKGLERWLGADWGGGLLILHVDETIGTPAAFNINDYTAGSHQGVMAEEASTANGSLLANTSYAHQTHLYYSGNNASFDGASTPDSDLYDGTATDISITGVSARSSTMTAVLNNPSGTGGAGDECVDAKPVNTMPYSDTTLTEPATYNPADPWPSCWAYSDNTAWYKYTPAANMAVSIDTFDSNYDTLLAVFSGGCGSLTEVACNDDDNAVTQSRVIVGMTAGTTYYIMIGSYGTGGGTTNINVHEPYTYADEDYETGDLSRWPWQLYGDGNWTVMSSVQHTGSYSAQAPQSIVDNQSADLSVTLGCSSGNISFWHSESSESGYDFLRFYVDGSMYGEWSGINGWSQATFPVSTGTHTFSWSYEKDLNASSGSDTAWVDDIVFPVDTIDHCTDGIQDFDEAGVDCGGADCQACMNPLSTITAPTDGSSLAASTYNVTGTATDNSGTGLAVVDISTDGGNTWHAATGTTAWSYTWSVPGPGGYTIMSRATDNDSNVQLAPYVVSVTVNGFGAPVLPHYGWDAAFSSNGCGLCHVTASGFLSPDYKELAGFCLSCHNTSSVAHELALTASSGHPVFVNVTSGGAVMPTYGNVTSVEYGNRAFASLAAGTDIACITCHNPMRKTEDFGRSWEFTTTSDLHTYTMQNGPWQDYGYLVPVVYRDTSLWSGPTNVNERKEFIVHPPEYAYDETAGTVTFGAAQPVSAYIYVGLGYPYLRISSKDNNLCSDCHTELTHMGANCMTCHQAHGSGNLADIRETLRTSDLSSRTVVFYSVTGSGSFADGDAVYDGICEVCHTATKYHRRDGSGFANHSGGVNQAGTDCTACHTHAGGFMKP